MEESASLGPIGDSPPQSLCWLVSAPTCRWVTLAPPALSGPDHLVPLSHQPSSEGEEDGLPSIEEVVQVDRFGLLLLKLHARLSGKMVQGPGEKRRTGARGAKS